MALIFTCEKLQNEIWNLQYTTCNINYKIYNIKSNSIGLWKDLYKNVTKIKIKKEIVIVIQVQKLFKNAKLFTDFI